MSAFNEDVIAACFDLIGRAGAAEGSLEWTCPHVPGEPDDHKCDRITWAAMARYRGARITKDGYSTPSEAAFALAERLLSGATCRCTKPVTLSDDGRGCRWRLVGQKWEPSCDAPSVSVPGERGDYGAIQAAMRGTNRAERRAARKRGKQP